MGRAFNVKIDERVKVLMSHLSKHSDFFFFLNKSLGLIIYKCAQTVRPSWLWVFNGVAFCSNFRSSTDALVMGKRATDDYLVLSRCEKELLRSTLFFFFFWMWKSIDFDDVGQIVYNLIWGDTCSKIWAGNSGQFCVASPKL